ncbi:MAG TPA: hypothetical protein ENJ09_10910 [Planctomycetes bacterium]|nr:hypothetical protein [Planctomycetota bacterium]
MVVAKRDYTVRLSRVFQGPMDLLLHLVREHEVEIQEIEISAILTDYLAYLEKLEALDIEVAGDFLVMAATLMAIKSRSLLPNEEVNLEEELDPKDELIQRLLEYRRFKGAAEALEASKVIRDNMAPRGWHEKPEKAERTFELGELTAWDLLATFSRLMRETLADRPHHVVQDPRPLRYYVDEVVSRLRTEGHASLRALMASFTDAPPREALVGSFCALLELVRLEVISVRQDGVGEDIEIEVVPEHASDLAEVVAGTLLDEEVDDAAADGGEDGAASPSPGSDPGPSDAAPGA